MLASPVCVIEESYAPKLIKRIADICSDKKAQLIVVGYPKKHGFKRW
jgi:RNase H-fold protein (predicted Holliday junction resolvase)